MATIAPHLAAGQEPGALGRGPRGGCPPALSPRAAGDGAAQPAACKTSHEASLCKIHSAKRFPSPAHTRGPAKPGNRGGLVPPTMGTAPAPPAPPRLARPSPRVPSCPTPPGTRTPSPRVAPAPHTHVPRVPWARVRGTRCPHASASSRHAAVPPRRHPTTPLDLPLTLPFLQNPFFFVFFFFFLCLLSQAEAAPWWEEGWEGVNHLSPPLPPWPKAVPALGRTLVPFSPPPGAAPGVGPGSAPPPSCPLPGKRG